MIQTAKRRRLQYPREIKMNGLSLFLGATAIIVGFMCHDPLLEKSDHAFLSSKLVNFLSR